MKTSIVNHLAVWSLVIYFQLQSMGWYTVFEKPWVELSKVNMETANNAGVLSYLVVLISTAVIVYSIAVLFTKLHIYTAINGIFYSLLFNIGFLFLPVITMDMFQMKPFALSMIDAGNYLVFFVITGLVLSLWKKYKKEA